MRLRAAHLACLVFLLSSLGVAEASAMSLSKLALRSGALADIYIANLLHQAAAQQQEDRLANPVDHSRTAEARPLAILAVTQTVAATHSPASQAAQVHTLTSLRR